MSTKIIIDSTVDLPAQLREKTKVVPLVVRFGEEEYLDSVTINYQQFYEKLLVCQDLPTSSQPNPDSFAEVYQSVVDAGDEAVVLTISGKLSGTYQSACIAAEDFKGIYVVDSTVAAVAAGVLAQYLCSWLIRAWMPRPSPRSSTRRRAACACSPCWTPWSS